MELLAFKNQTSCGMVVRLFLKHWGSSSTKAPLLRFSGAAQQRLLEGTGAPHPPETSALLFVSDVLGHLSHKRA